MDIQSPRQNEKGPQVPEYDPPPIETLTANDARQGVTGHGVRYVLAISLGLSFVALFLAWTYFT